jgi:hypothetical protein
LAVAIPEIRNGKGNGFELTLHGSNDVGGIKTAPTLRPNCAARVYRNMERHCGGTLVRL